MLSSIPKSELEECIRGLENWERANECTNSAQTSFSNQSKENLLQLWNSLSRTIKCVASTPQTHKNRIDLGAILKKAQSS